MIDLESFLALPHAISLLGMSGVGKTTLSKALHSEADWYHYSADYRIGTRYLSEPILDNIKQKIMAMRDPFVADLLRSDSIFIAHNISVDNLEPVSTFLGMYGDPAIGGLDKAEFLRRQELYRQAEVYSMQDVPQFIEKSWNIYQCRCFVNDASGSLCEIAEPDDPEDPVIQALINHSLLLYIRGDAATEEAIKERARTHPKPLFYNPDFILPQLVEQPDDGAGVDPIELARPLFPQAALPHHGGALRRLDRRHRTVRSGLRSHADAGRVPLDGLSGAGARAGRQPARQVDARSLHRDLPAPRRNLRRSGGLRR